MYKKIIYLFSIVFFVNSCGTLVEDAKRGITGEKSASTDEFLIKKKDPLIMPPDYQNLPTPDDRTAAKEQISDFEKTLGSSIEDTSTSSSSAESSILKKIQSQ